MVRTYFLFFVFGACSAQCSSQSKSTALLAASNHVPAFHVNASHALLVDMATGQALIEHNADKKMTPSSMTKIVTAYILFDALQNERIGLDEKVDVSKHAARQEGSRMFLIPHQSVSVQDLIKGIVVVSGNDACTAVAEHIEGQEEVFAQKMNAVAKQLGACHSHFVNASGLPHEDHYSTCWDLARISMATIDQFPKAYEKYYSMKEFCFNKINQPNRNTLLQTGADGMKTGQSSAGKFGMVVSEKRNGRRLLLVINGCPTARARAHEARRLLNIGFQQFHPLVLTKGMPVVSIPVWRGPPIQAVVGKEVKRSLGPGQKNVVITACYTSPVRGCVKPGDVVGSLRIDIPGTDSFDIPLHAKNGTKPGFFKRFVHGCARLFR